MRFHAIQNVETALRFLRYKEIKLVNIRGEDIVDGNPKLTLGLIWTIILHFQVGTQIFRKKNTNCSKGSLKVTNSRLLLVVCKVDWARKLVKVSGIN